MGEEEEMIPVGEGDLRDRHAQGLMMQTRDPDKHAV